MSLASPGVARLRRRFHFAHLIQSGTYISATMPAKIPRITSHQITYPVCPPVSL